MQVLSHKQAHERLGGVIGLHRLRELMNTGEIESFLLSNKLVTTEQAIEKYLRKMMEQNSTAKSYKTKHLVSN